MPERAAAFDGCEHVHDTEGENAFYRPRNQAESKGLGMILIPGLDVEGKKCWRGWSEKFTKHNNEIDVSLVSRVTYMRIESVQSSRTGPNSWRRRRLKPQGTC